MNKGFTLIELLIVIAIIGILASVFVVSVNHERELREVKEGYYALEGHETREWKEIRYDYLLIDGGRAYIK